MFSYEVIPGVHMTEKLKTYFELKAIQCGVSPIVLLTPYLAEVSNRMARSEIKKEG